MPIVPDRYRVIQCYEDQMADVLNREYDHEWKLVSAHRGEVVVDIGHHKRRWTLILEDDPALPRPEGP